MKVLKFGGSVLKNAEDVKNIAHILDLQSKNGEQIVVVVSAFFGITNKLLELVNLATNKNGYTESLNNIKKFHFDLANALDIDAENENEIENLFNKLEHILITIHDSELLSNDLRDAIISFGERLSSFIIFSYLAKFEDVAQIFPNELIKTNSNFGCATVNISESNDLISSCINNIDAKIIICAGFIGADANGKITTLGRNGSDYSAALIASSVNANVLEIWKDTDGLYTADPKIVKSAKFIKQITYQEMAELSSLGNKILHINAIAPCIAKHIPIVLRNCYNLSCPGTKVSDKECKNYLVNGIIKLDCVRVLTFSLGELIEFNETAIKLQKLLKNYEDIIITISQNIKQRKICLLVSDYKSDRLLLDIDNIFLKEKKNGYLTVEIGKLKSMITIVGADLINTCGVSGKIFGALEVNNINIDALNDDFSTTRISFLCNTDISDKVINLLHDELVNLH